jgi:galactose mutarotase-like enzyme
MKLLVLLLALVPFNGWAGSIDKNYRASTQGEFIALENGANIKAMIAPDRGGELSGLSIFFDGNWHELLYRGMNYTDQPGWRGKAPLLWPATGISVLESNQQRGYQLDNAFYEMPFHGFAKAQQWQVIRNSESTEMAAVTLQLKDSKETLHIYPFAFNLQIEYRLLNDRLTLLYKVEAGANNKQPMPFSIGNHITFNAPLIEGSHASQLQFENYFPEQLITGSDKAFRGLVKPSPFQGRHTISELPKRKSVSLGGQKGDPELTIYDPAGLGLKLVHKSSTEPVKPAIQFNLWADADAGFFSPEPWVGTQNSLNTGMGIISLQPGQTWQWQIDIIPTWNNPSSTINLKELQ